MRATRVEHCLHLAVKSTAQNCVSIRIVQNQKCLRLKTPLTNKSITEISYTAVNMLGGSETYRVANVLLLLIAGMLRFCSSFQLHLLPYFLACAV